MVQVVFEEYDRQHARSAFELVKCKLTLLYDYWQLNEVFHLTGIICLSLFYFVFIGCCPYLPFQFHMSLDGKREDLLVFSCSFLL